MTPRPVVTLPELMTVGQLARELGQPRSAALKLFRQLPEQQIPGHKRTYVRRSDVEKFMDAHYFQKRPAAA